MSGREEVYDSGVGACLKIQVTVTQVNISGLFDYEDEV